MSRQATWTNPDGLVVGFGPRDTVNAQNGPYKTEGLHKESVKGVVGVDIGATDTAAVQGYEVPIPANAVITAAYIEVDVEFDSAGDTATLSVGLKEKDGTEISADGIDSGILEAALTAGALVTCDGALIGASVGSVDSYIKFTYGTEAFTSGSGKLIVEYLIKPSA